MNRAHYGVLAAAMLLAACGGSDGDESSGTPSTPASQPPATTLIAGAPTLVIAAGGAAPGVEYDTVKVAGRAALSGNLQLDFTNGYRPAAGQRFVVLTAAGGLTGRFDAVNAQGIAYAMAYDANSATVVFQ